MDKLFIVTGANRGLGKALTEGLLEANQSVLAINRSSSSKSENTIICDLADATQLNELTEKLKKITKYYEIIFINNAGVIEPIGNIGSFLSIDKIQQHINVNYLAPICIINALMQIKNINLKVINVTTGAAERYLEGWSLYGSSKKAVKVALDTLMMENSNIDIVHFDPGVIDTNMQTKIRDSEFKLKERFVQYKEKQKLQAPEEVAKRIIRECNII